MMRSRRSLISSFLSQNSITTKTPYIKGVFVAFNFNAFN